MNYIFPYNLIERGSKVAIYGFGRVGRDFFEQIISTDYCQCVLCVDRSFDVYKIIERPFGRVSDIISVDYDYLIIAIQSKIVADEIIETVLKMGVDKEKIIWSPYYFMKNLWPNNKKRFLESPDYYIDVVKKYRIANSIYGGGEFYQSYSELGFWGTRNIQERIAIYQVKKFVKNTDVVLDIGCNCGFFDLQLSEYVKKIRGIDVESKFIEIANRTKDFVGVKNAEFSLKDFQTEYEDNKCKYDAVFALAIHTNVFQTGIDESQFVDEVFDMLCDKGVLFFESHNLINDRERFERLCNLFFSKGMKLIHRENYFSDFDRDIVVMRKVD